MTRFNEKDLAVWERIFSDVPPEWKSATPTEDMEDCLRYFRQNGVETVLDIGCGVGIWAMFFARSGFAVSGYDFSPKAIEFAKRWAAEEELDIEYACCPVTIRAFPGQRFDGIIAAKILDNISRTELSIAQEHIYDSLNPNGILFCLFNPVMTAKDIEEIKQSDNPTKGITHNLYSNAELKDLFSELMLLKFKTYEHGFRGMFLQKK